MSSKSDLCLHRFHLNKLLDILEQQQSFYSKMLHANMEDLKYSSILAEMHSKQANLIRAVNAYLEQVDDAIAALDVFPKGTC